MPSFFLASGAGNDFIALPEPAAPPTPDEIRAWCRRGVSVGSDGLFVLRRDGAAVVMDYFNGDGRAADLCINGTRCAARLAFELGWADGEVEVVTGAGPVRARRLEGSDIALELPRPDEPRELAPEVDGRPWPGLFLRVGVPHFVLPWPAPLGEAPVATLGAALRHHPAMGPAGTNVDFVRYPAVHPGQSGRIEVRSFERGVEAETLACGTGVLAAAAAGLARGALRLPAVALTTGGFEMTVAEVAPDGSSGAGSAGGSGGPAAWSLAGDARLVARGELLPEASRAPRPPQWSSR